MAIAQPSLMSVYNSAQHFVRTSAVEPTIANIISALQDIGIPVIGLTARGYSIRHQTLRQLADMGVDFHETVLFLMTALRVWVALFLRRGDKGENLNTFLSRLERVPRHIVMLDDKKNTWNE